MEHSSDKEALLFLNTRQRAEHSEIAILHKKNTHTQLPYV